MAAKHLIRKCTVQQLISISSNKGCTVYSQPMVLQTSFAHLGFLTSISVRKLHLSRFIMETEKSSKLGGTQAVLNAAKSKSFSLLKYFKKSVPPVPLKVDSPPVGNFTTGSAKEMSKNLGNFRSSKTTFSEFFSVRELLSTPSVFMVYGLGGLIPFISVPVCIYYSSYTSWLAFAQLTYGASILSFLGGVSWGSELSKPHDATFKSLGYSISLPLIAWTSVLIYPNIVAFPVMMCGVAAAGYFDTHWQSSYPLWFKNLRLVLSTLVALSLGSTFVLGFVMPSELTLNSSNDDK